MLRTCFQQSLERLAAMHVILFPSLATYYLTPHERELKANCIAVRNFVSQIVDKRRLEMINKNQVREDLLSLLLEDPLFNENNEAIIDELLTIFLAGSQSTANVTQNLIL